MEFEDLKQIVSNLANEFGLNVRLENLDKKPSKKITGKGDTKDVVNKLETLFYGKSTQSTK